MERVACARIHHEGVNGIIQTDASNALNSVLRKPILEQVTVRTPAFTGFAAKCYGERPASVLSQMDSGKRTELECPRGVQQGDALGPALCCLLLRPVLTRVREKCESQGVEACAYLDDITIAADKISLGKVGVVPLLGRELTVRVFTPRSGQDGCLDPEGNMCPRRERYHV